MDVAFYSKPQPLLSSSSSCTAHLRRPASLGREFFGFGGCSRLHGVVSRRRRRELRGIRRRAPPRCSIGDPFNTDAFLAVAAAAATAVAVRIFYMEHARRSNRVTEFSHPEIPDVSVNDQLQQSSYEMDSIVQGSQTLGPESAETVNSTKETKETVVSRLGQTLPEKGNDSDVKDMQVLEFGRDISMHDTVLTSDMSQATGFEVSASSPCENLEKETSGGSGLTYLSELVTNPCTIEPDSMQKVLSVKQEDAAEITSPFETTNQVSSSGSVTPVNNMLTQIIKDNQLVHEAAFEGEHQFPRPDALFGQSVSARGTFALKEEIQAALSPISDFRCLSRIPRRFTLQDNNAINSQQGPSFKRVKLPMTRSQLSTDKSEELVPHASNQEASAGHGEEIPSPKSLMRDKGRRLMHQSRSRKKTRFPQSSGMRVGDDIDPSLCLSSYNRLLRDVRLNECVDLLEGMERKGILDMDKVYHTRFLKNCKMQKAVKEAFRFSRLIRNPTLSTFNMLLSVCANSQDYEGALHVLLLVKEAGLRPDCHLYTTLISTCGKSGKVDAMFEVFHEMVNAGIEPNVHTYGALIDGCARAGQVAKAFGAYGIMRSKSVKPDRVIFNALITACGQSGAVDRAFDVLAEMMAEPQPIDPDHVTVGALMKTCIQAGQADRAREVYKMLHQFKIKGTPDVYTIAVKNCSLTGDLEFALGIYDDMRRIGIKPDEMFLSTLVDVAGHAGKVEVAFEILHDARVRGIHLGTMSYSSLMGACSNAKNWQKALELYEEIKAIQLYPTVSTLNALITSLCDGDQLLKAVEVLSEMKEVGVCPNIITYSILLVACEKKDEVELGFDLFSQAKTDGVLPNLIMCRCLTGLCLRRFEKAYSLGEPILSFDSGKPQIDSKWTKWAIMVYRQTVSAGVIPSTEAFSQVLGCLKFPNDTSLRNRFIENLGLSLDTSRHPNLFSLLDGFGEYDPRSFSILEEASSLGAVPCVSFKDSPIIVDARKLQTHTAEVYLLTVLKGLKHRLAAGARLPNVMILLPTERTQVFSREGQKTINIAGRVGRSVGAMLRRLGLPYQGDESYGKIRVNGLTIRRWFKPKISSLSLGGKPADLTSSQTRLAKEIANQQRSIRSSYSLSFE